MLALVHLRADSPFVIGAEESRPILGQRAVDRRANLLHLADQLGAATPDTFGLIDAIRDRRIARSRRRVLREVEPSHAQIPHGAGRDGVRQMTEVDGRQRRVELLGRISRLGRRRRLGIRPELTENALGQLPARRQARRELRKDLVLFVLPWKVWIGARLTVVVTLALVSGEEPQPIAGDRTAEGAREVTILVAFVAGLRALVRAPQRLTRQR